MKKVIATILMLMTLCCGVASAQVERSGGSDSFIYSVYNSQKFSGYTVTMNYIFHEYMGVGIVTHDYKTTNAVYFYTPAYIMRMSKQDPIVLHIGKITYGLRNKTYEAKDKNAYCTKGADVPLNVGYNIRMAIVNKKAVYFTVPLDDGTYFTYTPTDDELEEFADAYDAFYDELN